MLQFLRRRSISAVRRVLLMKVDKLGPKVWPTTIFYGEFGLPKGNKATERAAAVSEKLDEELEPDESGCNV